ncbi:hypothetical protein HDV00_004247 [Rhizophlyctis rosea]|nr:hypothetical protein HDV00_004247 [Rhizophlyctis rosea]
MPTHVNSPEEHSLVARVRAAEGKRKERAETAWEIGKEEYDCENLWKGVRSLLAGSDAILMNLETSATTHPSKWPNKTFNYRMHPCNLQALKSLSVAYCSLANNHILDFGVEGLLDTVESLERMGIAFAGAGRTHQQAVQPTCLQLPLPHSPTFPKHTLTLYSATDHPASWSHIPSLHYIPTNPPPPTPHITNILTASHPTTQPNTTIFSFHWGPIYTWRPSTNIQSLAHTLISSGVDIIHGHSSHHVQGVEFYQDGVILYGCGDFIDDYAVDAEYRNDLGCVWRVVVEPGQGVGGRSKVMRVEAVPTVIKGFRVYEAGVGGSDWRWVVEKVRGLSGEFGTKSRVEDGKIMLEKGLEGGE